MNAIELKEYLNSKSLIDVFEEPIEIYVRTEEGDTGGNLTDTYKKCTMFSVAYMSVDNTEPRKVFIIG